MKQKNNEELNKNCASVAEKTPDAKEEPSTCEDKKECSNTEEVQNNCPNGCSQDEAVCNNSEAIAKLEEENKELVEKVKLAQAELINYRRRKDEETTSLLKYANQDLIMELIILADNFERAIKLDDNDLTDELSKFLAGFKMMYASLMDTLKKFGVEEINRAGQIFDPTQEQALMTEHVEGMEDDVVIEVLLKGYKLKDRVIRPASVKINQN